MDLATSLYIASGLCAALGFTGLGALITVHVRP